MLVWEIEVNVQKFANDITSQYKMGVVNFTVLQSITFIFLLILAGVVDAGTEKIKMALTTKQKKGDQRARPLSKYLQRKNRLKPFLFRSAAWKWRARAL